MIFGRRSTPKTGAAPAKGTDQPAEVEPDEVEAEPTPAELSDADRADDDQADGDRVEADQADADLTDGAEADGAEADGDQAEAEADPDEWAALDLSQDWRHDGPFDHDEVDLDADDVERLDLGVLIITPTDGMELRLQVNEADNVVTSAVVLLEESAMELSVFAAPRTPGLWAEIRGEIIAATEQAGGTSTLAEGPFGTELRRLMTVRTEEGEDAYQPSRTWVAEGPRWLLRGILYGQAALVEGLAAPAAEFHDIFCNLVVNRGAEAKAPGDLIGLTLPAALVEAQD